MSSRQDALGFAAALRSRLIGKGAVNVRSAVAATPGYEHKALAPLIQEVAAELAGPDVHVDWEGNRARKGRQAHSYKLLGTATHPDAAVLNPFRCAVEFDRERSGTGVSYFKDALMKAACHTLSGAYDATLFVFTLTREKSTPETYLTDYGTDQEPYTPQLLKMLDEQGVVIAIVPHA